MKRLIACLAVACVVGFALAGCSSGAKAPGSTGSAPSASSGGTVSKPAPTPAASGTVPPPAASTVPSGAYETGAKKGGGPATAAKADQVKIGMKLADVENIMGQPGKKLGEVTVAGVNGAMYAWYGEKPDTSLIIQFTNGAVSSKSATGLK